MKVVSIHTILGVTAGFLAWPWLVAGQVVINEVLVKNETTLRNTIGFETYVELYNTSTSVVSLAGWTLTDATNTPAKFIFPEWATIPANGYVYVWCDKAITEPGFHADFKLKDVTDDLGLFSGSNLVDYVAFGIQVPDLSISRIPNGLGPWQLGLPTPGNNNRVVALGTPLALRINEWMAANSHGDDWLELFNPQNSPVLLSGLVLSDGSGAGKRAIPNLSFIKPFGFARFWADSSSGNYDADHLGFKISKSGDGISLYPYAGAGATSRIDAVIFGPQTTDISMGRLPDGSTNITAFPLGNSSPEYSNYLPITNVVVNELLAHTDPPLEDAVEFYNPTAAPVNIGNWWLSDDQHEPQKFRIPTNTIIGPFGYLVFYEGTAWNKNRTGVFPEFTFGAARGGQVVLSSGNSAGTLTGYRLIQDFGASVNGVSFGRYLNSLGEDQFVAVSAHTFGVDDPGSVEQFRQGQGAPNAYPLVGPLVISGIMYHPQDFLVGDIRLDNTVEEFIELHNISSNAVPLYDPTYPANTWRLRDAVDFDFPSGTVIPAGGYLAVVPFDPASAPAALEAFYNRYHITTNFAILGPYQGKLANNGDTIELRKPDNPNVTEVPYVLVERVEYAANAPWPMEADGTGFSLQRVNLMQYANDPANWYASRLALARPQPALVINEILVQGNSSWQAAIELANTSDSPVDISFWWLSNDEYQPKKYRFPTNTVIAPFGFLTVDESAFNPDGTGVAPSFTWNPAQGGEVIIASADASGNLTGYWLAELFGATEQGVSLGPHTGSDGRANLVPLSACSLGASNPKPLVGPIVISEILYHPPDIITYSNQMPIAAANTADEFIELQNLSSVTVPLYSTATNAPRQFTNTWRLRNEVEFDFPLNIALPPNGRLLVVNFDPVSNPEQQIQFRSRYGVPGNVRLLGPFAGALNNRSGTIELYKPGPVQSPPSTDAGSVPYILVEKVHYEDRAPWPANTDGTGFSLQRIDLTSYADDLTNWFSAYSTAGSSNIKVPAHITHQPPETMAVPIGSNVTLTASADGVGLIAYQWYFNGMVLTNETTNSLRLSNMQPTNEGAYQLVVSNLFGMDTSAVSQLIMAVKPAFLIQPSNQIVMLGERVEVTATVSGTPPFGFKWWKQGRYLTTNIVNGFTDTLVIPSALLSDAGIYRVYVTNAAFVGGSASQFGSVSVVQPLGERMVLAGSNITITANVAALGLWFYQWQFNDTNILGATNRNLTLTNLLPEQSGDYTMLLSLGSSFTGLVKAISCPLTVQTTATAPEIVQPPASLRIPTGAKALLQVAAIGTDPLSYQWWQNQTNLVAFATNNFLAFTNVTTLDLGSYAVVVSNQFGTVTSVVARLVALEDSSMAPAITRIGALSASVVTFSFGTTPGFSYQLEYKNELAAAGWTPLGPPHTGDGNPVTINEPMASTQRFYRVVLLP